MGWWKETIDIVKKNDPAARSSLEIILTYPGIKALAAHRLSHFGAFGHKLKFTQELKSLKEFLLTTVQGLLLEKQLSWKKELCSIMV